MSNDSRTDDPRPLTRRSTLQAFGALLVGGSVAGSAATAPDDDAYTVVQGDRTFAVEPISGDVPVEQFYSFRLPDGYSGTGVHDVSSGPYYESVGTRALQRESTTITFLYDGPNGLSLVVVHDRSVEEAGADDDGGSATWDVSIHEADPEWLVKDDEYRDTDTGERAESNYDRWDTDGVPHRIDWTWAAGGTDGGVLGFLGAKTALLIDPSYNEQATLYGEHYEGDVTDWEFLGGSVDDPERVSLALDEPVAIVGPNGNLSAVTSGEDQEEETDETTEEETTQQETTQQETTEEETGAEETSETEDRHDDDDDEDDDDEREELEEEIEEKRKEIEEKREEMKEESGEEREELREEIEEKREEIKEKREEVKEAREDLEDDDDDDEREGSLGRGNGKAKGKKKGKHKGKSGAGIEVAVDL